MAKTLTRPWDPAEHMQTEDDVAAYLEAASEEDDPDLMSAALDDAARARTIAETAEGWAKPGVVVGSYIREESKGTHGDYGSQPEGDGFPPRIE